MHKVTLLIVSVCAIAAHTWTIKPGKVTTSLSASIGWQYTAIDFEEGGDSLSIIDIDAKTSESTYRGSSPQLDFYASPVLAVTAGVRLNAQMLTLALETTLSRLSTPSTIDEPVIYQFSVGYRYIFLRSFMFNPFLQGGVGFHRFTLDNGFSDAVLHKKTDITYSGKFYQLGCGVSHQITKRMTISAESNYRWLIYHNIVTNSEYIYPTILWGKNITGYLTATWEF